MPTNDLTTRNPIESDRDLFVWPGGAAVEEGDLMFLTDASDELKRASQITWDNNLATTQDNAGPRFVGVAGQSLPASYTDEVARFPVIRFLEREVDCTSDTYEIGDLVAPADGGSSTLANQAVAKTSSVTAAIGHVIARYADATTRIKVRLYTRLLPPFRPQADSFSRAGLTQEDNASYRISLLDWNTNAGAKLGAAAGTPSGAFGLTAGTHGSAAPKIVSEAASGNSKTNTMRTLFTLPPEYVAGQSVTLRVRVAETVGAATVETKIDAEVYKCDLDGGIGSDLCATAVADVDGATPVNKDFTITPTGLAAGDVLDIELTGTINDTGGTVGTILAILDTRLLLDIKG